MKKFLAIDTATIESSISLILPDKFTIKPLVEKNQTKEIIPIIKELLKEKNLTLRDLDGIAICIGPGTFTGTRVGVMTAKTLSYTTDIPLIPFSTFDLFEDKEPYAILDAKCGRCHLFHNGETTLIPHNELEGISQTIYTIDQAPFKITKNLQTTKKNLSCLLKVFDETKSVTHQDLKVTYPTTL